MSHAKGKSKKEEHEFVEQGQTSPFGTHEPEMHAKLSGGRPMVAICTPIQSMSRMQLTGFWTVSLFNLFIHTQKFYDVQVFFDQTFGFGYSRSILAAKALKAGASWIFWLDSDTLVASDTITRMIDCEKQIVTAPYYTRGGKMHPVLYTLDDNFRGHVAEVPKCLAKVDACGLGACLMNTAVFAIMIDKVPDNIDIYGDRPFRCTNPETGAPRWNFFCVHETPEGVVTGEDIMFFVTLKKYTKIKVWCDPSIRTAHTGECETICEDGKARVERM